MDIKPRILKKYVRLSGKCPYDEWFEDLRDLKAKAVIDARLIRVRRGNFGNARSVGDGVIELKIPYGPGYRVYFAEVDDEIVVLLFGGDKGSQNRDIQKAKEFWQEYKSRR